MAATRDIVATYTGPGKVMRRLLGQGTREDRALIFLIVACILVFVAQTPRLAREAYETETELNALLGGSLMGWLFIAPLLMYLIAGLTALIGKALRTGLSGFGARMALFWALLASSPLMLLWGLTAGFVGPGIEMDIVGVAWLVAFLWFWIAGLITAAQEAA